jgi:hypothetical protein
LGRIKDEIYKKNEKKEEKNKQKIKELANELNKFRKKILEFEGEDDFDDSPKIQTIFKIESSFIKE